MHITLPLVLAVFSVFFSSCDKGNSINSSEYQVSKTVKIGDTVDMELPLDGVNSKSIRFKELAGKTVFINFWASWCVPCIVEMPSIYKMAKELGTEQYAVIGINMDESGETGMKFLKSKVGDPPFAIFHGLNKPIMKIFEITGVPFSVIIDKAGVVRYSEAGERDWASKESLAIIKKY